MERKEHLLGIREVSGKALDLTKKFCRTASLPVTWVWFIDVFLGLTVKPHWGPECPKRSLCLQRAKLLSQRECPSCCLLVGLILTRVIIQIVPMELRTRALGRGEKPIKDEDYCIEVSGLEVSDLFPTLGQ